MWLEDKVKKEKDMLDKKYQEELKKEYNKKGMPS
jgi:hypothetical protein